MFLGIAIDRFGKCAYLLAITPARPPALVHGMPPAVHGALSPVIVVWAACNSGMAWRCMVLYRLQ